MIRNCAASTPKSRAARRAGQALLTAALFDDALADNEPLFRTISRYVDDRDAGRHRPAYDRGGCC